MALEDKLLSAQVKVAIIDHAPNAEVMAKKGDIYIKISSSEYREEQLIKKVTETTQGVMGVKSIDIDVVSHMAFGD